MGRVQWMEYVLAAEDKELVDLIDVAVDLVVEDEEDEQLLHLSRRDVQLLIDTKTGKEASLGFVIDHVSRPHIHTDGLRKTLAMKGTATRVYGLMSSRRTLVLISRRMFLMNCSMKGSPMITVLFSLRIFSTLLISLCW
jgi:hypothetical protein